MNDKEYFRRTLDLLEEFDQSPDLPDHVYFFDKEDGTIITIIEPEWAALDKYVNYVVAPGFTINVTALKIHSDCRALKPGYRGSLGQHGLMELIYTMGASTTVNEAFDPNKVLQLMPAMTELVRTLLRDGGLEVPSDLKALPPPSGAMAMRDGNVFQLVWHSSELARIVAELSGMCGPE